MAKKAPGGQRKSLGGDAAEAVDLSIIFKHTGRSDKTWAGQTRGECPGRGGPRGRRDPRSLATEAETVLKRWVIDRFASSREASRGQAEEHIWFSQLSSCS